MNRYVRDGLVAEMRSGRRVILATENGLAARAALEELANVCTDDETIRRANGQERITHPHGGSIRIIPIASERFRGLSADVVFVDADPTPERRGIIRPVVAASMGGELILR